MSDLVSSVQEALTQYVQSKQETHVPIDVWRMIRDQAALQYERQKIVDALTADPMGGIQHPLKVRRLCRLLQVIECHRVVTHEGLSTIQAVVQITKDEQMEKSVDQHVQLWFNYERRSIEQSTGPQEGTHIKYSIDISKDCDQRHRLLVVECWAAGNAPSMEQAVPMDGWEDMETDDEEDDMDGIKAEGAMEGVKQEETDNKVNIKKDEGIAASDDNKDEEEDLADRYAAYIDPDVLQLLKEWSGLDDMEEGPLFFLLMTFPYWEHEWDLVGFVLDAVFGEEEDDDDDVEVIEYEDEEDDENKVS